MTDDVTGEEDQPEPERPPGMSTREKWIAIGVIALVGLFIWALADPHAQIPVISEIACSLKNDRRHDGDHWGDPGCYPPDS